MGIAGGATVDKSIGVRRLIATVLLAILSVVLLINLSAYDKQNGLLAQAGLTDTGEPTQTLIPTAPSGTITRTLFLPIVQRSIGATPVPTVTINHAEAYGVGISHNGERPRWNVVSVYHLSGAENGGAHNVFVKVLLPNGERDRNQDLRIGWSWEGQQPGEVAQPARLDKPDGERGHGDIPIEKGVIATVWIEGDGSHSDYVYGLHSMHPDEEAGNTWGHHSFVIVFQKAVSD